MDVACTLTGKNPCAHEALLSFFVSVGESLKQVKLVNINQRIPGTEALLRAYICNTGYSSRLSSAVKIKTSNPKSSVLRPNKLHAGRTMNKIAERIAQAPKQFRVSLAQACLCCTMHGSSRIGSLPTGQVGLGRVAFLDPTHDLFV